MHIVLVSGSHRQKSNSLRITEYLAKRLETLGATQDIIELKGNPLPLWDETAWQAGSDLQKQWEPYSKRLKAADGFVITSPEWHGMVPSGLKNFFIFAAGGELAHKPAMITTVSASRGGAYPVDELRVSSYKNSFICYIPQHLIVRDAAEVFNGDVAGNETDTYMRERADFTLKLLLQYAKAMKPMRESGATFDKRFANGM